MVVRLLPSLQTPHSTIFGAKRARTCILFVVWEPIMSLMAESGLRALLKQVILSAAEQIGIGVGCLNGGSSLTSSYQLYKGI